MFHPYDLSLSTLSDGRPGLAAGLPYNLMTDSDYDGWLLLIWIMYRMLNGRNAHKSDLTIFFFSFRCRNSSLTYLNHRVYSSSSSLSASVPASALASASPSSSRATSISLEPSTSSPLSSSFWRKVATLIRL